MTTANHEKAARYLADAARHRAGGAWQHAASALEQAVALEPLSSTYDQLGVVSERLKRYARAELSYQEALRLDPAYTAARYHLGMLYRSRGLPDQAVAELEAVLPSVEAAERDRLLAVLTELKARLTCTCAACGCTSPLIDQFREVKRRGTLCPRCFGRLQEARQRRSFYLLVAFVCGTAALYGLAALLGLPLYELANLALLYVVIYLLIVPHELAHAFMAWLAGCRIFELRLGVGPRLAAARVGSVSLTLHRYPLAGMCMMAPTRLDRLRRQVLLAVLGGPLFNLLLVLVLLPGFRWEHLATALAPLEVLLLASALHVVSSFVGRAYAEGANMAPDGVQIVLLLMQRWQASFVYAAHFLGGALYSWRDGNYPEMRAQAEAGLKILPEHPYLSSMRGAALLELGRLAEARTVFAELNAIDADALARYAVQTSRAWQARQRGLFRATNLNNLAYASLLLENEASERFAARQMAEEAFRLAPWVASIEGTLGAAMILTGDPVTGMDHVRAAAVEDERDRDRASHEAWLAIGHAQLGQEVEAQAALAAAEGLDPACPAVAKAKACLRRVEPMTASDGIMNGSTLRSA